MSDTVDVDAAEASSVVSEELSGLNLIELMEKLEPLPLSEPISLWPQTQAWAWLLLVAGGVFLWWGLGFLKRWQASAYRRAALSEIDQAGEDPVVLAGIIRRVAVCAYSREVVAGLHGDEWLTFLESRCQGLSFLRGPGRVLIQAPYQTSASLDAHKGLSHLVADWVKGHEPLVLTNSRADEIQAGEQ